MVNIDLKNKSDTQILKFGLLFLLLIGASACFTVKYSMSGASIPVDAKTFSVQYIVNNAPIVYPQFSQELTDALKDKFQNQTSLKLINDVGDLDFEGEITAYNVKPVAIQSGDVAAKNRLTVTIRIKYSNRLDPTFEFDKSFTRFEDYDSAQDLKNVEADLVETIIEQLVEDVFNESVVNW